MGMCKPSGGIIKRIGRIGSLKKQVYQILEKIYMTRTEICCNKGGMVPMDEQYGIGIGLMVEENTNFPMITIGFG